MTTFPARASVNLVGRVSRALMTSMSARAVRVETTPPAATLRAPIFVHVTPVTSTGMGPAEVITGNLLECQRSSSLFVRVPLHESTTGNSKANCNVLEHRK